MDWTISCSCEEPVYL